MAGSNDFLEGDLTAYDLGTLSYDTAGTSMGFWDSYYIGPNGDGTSDTVDTFKFSTIGLSEIKVDIHAFGLPSSGDYGAYLFYKVSTGLEVTHVHLYYDGGTTSWQKFDTVFDGTDPYYSTQFTKVNGNANYLMRDSSVNYFHIRDETSFDANFDPHLIIPVSKDGDVTITVSRYSPYEAELDYYSVNSSSGTVSTTPSSSEKLNYTFAVTPYASAGGGTIPGSVSPPEPESASIKNNKLTIEFSDSLDKKNLPAADAFEVLVDGSATSISGVKVKGSKAELMLGTKVDGGKTVSISYSDPTTGDDGKALQSTEGTDVGGFSDYSVTNLGKVKPVKSSSTDDDLTAKITDGGTLTLDAGSGAHGYVLDMKKISTAGDANYCHVIINNWSSDDSLTVKNEGESSFEDEIFETANPLFKASVTKDYFEVMVSFVGVNSTGTAIANLDQFNALTVGDIL